MWHAPQTKMRLPIRTASQFKKSIVEDQLVEEIFDAKLNAVNVVDPGGFLVRIRDQA